MCDVVFVSGHYSNRRNGQWGGLFYSSDNGLNWNSTNITAGNISSCAINCSATNAIASIYNGKIYYSTNLTTYTASNSPDLYWVDVSISNGNSFGVNGAVLACACTSNYNRGIYYSNDSGITWNEITLTRQATSTYTSVHISSNGYYVVATPSYGKIITNLYWWGDGYINNVSPYVDSTLSYVESNSPVRNWSSVAMSDDGVWGVACAKVPTVYDLGDYTIAPWSLSAYPKLDGAKWIWNSPTAATYLEPSQFMWFYGTFNTSSAESVVVTVVVDDIGLIYLNDKFIGLPVYGITSTYVINTTVINGTNSIRVLCTNMSPFQLNPAGLIMSIRNATTNSLLFSTSASMKCQTPVFSKVITVSSYGGGTLYDYSGNNVTTKLVNTTYLKNDIDTHRVPVIFHKRFYWSGADSVIGTLYVRFDDECIFILFNDHILSNPRWTSYNTVISEKVTIRSGENIISVFGVNVGRFYVVFGAALWYGNTHIISSNSSWYYLDDNYEAPYNTLYRTNDFGQTWTAVENAPIVSYNKVAVSSTGQYGLATIDGSANMLYTKNYGKNWSEVGKNIGGISLPQWGAVALSGTGKYALAALRKFSIYTTGYVYQSSL